MLDDDRTSAKLKGALETAFSDWHAKDPARNTKAALAREVSQRTGKKCTPQSVSGWFKTGRMDKKWLRVVGEVLGRSLGFITVPDLGPMAIQAFLDAGLGPNAARWVTDDIEVPPLIRDALPGRSLTPPLYVTFADGRRLFIEIHRKAEPLEEQTGLLLLQRKHPDVFRVLGHAGGGIYHEAQRLAEELRPLIDGVPTLAATPAIALGEQSSLGGLDWLAAGERELIEAYREILPEDRAAAVKDLLAKGAEAKRYREFFLQQTGAKDVVPDGKLEKLRAPAHEPPSPRGHAAPASPGPEAPTPTPAPKTKPKKVK